MTSMSILVRVCTWVQAFYKHEALGALMGSLDFALHIVAKLLCSCLCLFDAIVDLHAKHEKMFNDYLIG